MRIVFHKYPFLEKNVCAFPALFPQKKQMPENTEASLLGAAIIGMTAMKIYPDMDHAISKMVHSKTLPDSSSELKNAAGKLFDRYLAEADKI